MLDQTEQTIAEMLVEAIPLNEENAGIARLEN